jgi:hypothetical protein
MTSPSPFDHRPDTRLGQALKEALTVGDHVAFTRRVLAAAERAYGAGPIREEWWDVLTGWARPGVAAAAALAVAATLWVALASSRGSRDVTLEDVFRPAGESDAAAMLVAGAAPPDLDQLLAVAFRER